MVTARTKRIFEPLLHAPLDSPFPVGTLEDVLDHESGGRGEIVVADKVDGASELGATQLVVEHDAMGKPKLSSKSGAIGANVDPLTPLGALWGAQYVYQRAMERFTEEMLRLKLIVPSIAQVAAWTALMQFQHSIGTARGGFRVLMSRGVVRGMRHPIVILDFFARREMPPKLGRQSPELVRLRIKRLLDLPRRAALLAPMPTTIHPLPERPEGIPVFNAARAKRYILAERSRAKAGRPRKANGSPL